MIGQLTAPRSRRAILVAGLLVLALVQVLLAIRSRFAKETGRFVVQVAYDPAGDRLAWVSEGADGRGKLVVWDFARRRARLEIPCEGFDTAIGSNVACAFASLDFSPDGEAIVTAVRSRPDVGPRVVRWNAETGEPTSVLAIDSEVVGPVFARDGDTLAGIGRDRTVKLWNPRKKESVEATLRAGKAPATSLAFARDGETLATGWGDGVVRFWSLAKHEWRSEWDTHARGIARLAYSPDGKMLAVAGSDGVLKIWDVASETEKSSHSGFANACRSMVFSPDGSMLALKFAESSVGVLWDVNHRKPLANFPNASGGLAFAPDGRTLATAGGSKGKVFMVASPPLR